MLPTEYRYEMLEMGEYGLGYGVFGYWKVSLFASILWMATKRNNMKLSIKATCIFKVISNIFGKMDKGNKFY